MPKLNPEDFITFGHVSVRKDEVRSVELSRRGLRRDWVFVELRDKEGRIIGSHGRQVGNGDWEKRDIKRMQEELFGADLGFECVGTVPLKNRILWLVWGAVTGIFKLATILPRLLILGR
ncbi:hypothetical protein J2847_006784 [Azospirillum agricola]|uniref:hypothetical protein n=1 Tax=Azospirillum agricola TaxID=1720247 RepID=UPI001AEB77E2|nr:hypothetical protein [Azospirillum agricola]MBP2233446.1 hypothetical protein [Azospirillum agricola]